MPHKKLTSNDIEWLTTEDGSITGRRRDLGIHYKSIHGAQTESRHIFVNGTNLIHRTDNWHVGELGFGLGCNFSQTAAAAKEKKVRLLYESIDREPPPPECIPSSQAYAPLIQEALAEVRATGCTAEVSRAHIVLRLHPSPWQGLDFKTMSLHAAFHDPFAPADNPESWTVECFQWWRQKLSPTGRIATYSAAGHVRRALAAAGFWIARAPGPGRKREITIASQTKSALSGLELITKYKAK